MLSRDKKVAGLIHALWSRPFPKCWVCRRVAEEKGFHEYEYYTACSTAAFVARLYYWFCSTTKISTGASHCAFAQYHLVSRNY